MQHRSIPDIHIVPVASKTTTENGSSSLLTAHSLADLREKRVEEFLEARSLAPKSQRAYRQDLQRFMEWSDQT
jgi:integrase/recombinase XerD